MKYLEINDNIIDIDDIIMAYKDILEIKESFRGKETIKSILYKLYILFRYSKYEQYISFNCKDDMDKAYDTIKQSLIK